MTAFDGAPLTALADIWHGLVRTVGSEAAAMQAWQAMDTSTVECDPDRSMALTLLALDHLPENYRQSCLLEMAWHSVHGSRPDYALHRRCVDQWWEGSGRAWVAETKPLPSPKRSRRDGRIRIGFLVQELIQNLHYLETLIIPTLSALQRDVFSVFLYSAGDHEAPDHLTRLLDGARRIGNPDTAGREIAADDLDVLFYVNGFGQFSPFRLLRARPAKRIVSIMHCYSTFGPALVDAVVQDSGLITPIHRQILHEAIVETAGPAFLQGPSSFAPPVTKAPRHKTGQFVFGVMNRANKINKEMVDAWAQILSAVPGSILLFASFSYRFPSWRRYVQTLLSEAGVSEDRVVIQPYISSTKDYLSLYSDIDIALDTATFNGGITTLDAIWQGVPVVTLAVEEPNGCLGRYHMSHVGRADLVTTTPADYVARAVALAGDDADLDQWRDTARDRLLRSQLVMPGNFSERIAAAVSAVLATPSGPERASNPG